MKAVTTCALIILFSSVFGVFYGQEKPYAKGEIPLFQGDSSCSCVATKKETDDLVASEQTVGKSIYQVFMNRTSPHQELFRAYIGRIVNAEELKWWNYGISDEGDFNGDGKADYTWYGGDDTSDAMYLFLSSTQGYKAGRRHKNAWNRRFHVLPNLAGDLNYGINSIAIAVSSGRMLLLAEIEKGSLALNPKTYSFRISQADFKS